MQAFPQSLITVHNTATNYEKRNALKAGTNTSTISTWSIFQLFLSSNNYRAAETCRCVAANGSWWGDALTLSHNKHLSLSLVRVICTNHPEDCLCLNSWLIFPKPIKEDVALWCVWIIMLRRKPKAWYVAYSFILVIWTIILLSTYNLLYCCYKWSSKLNLVATTKIM